MRDYFTAAREFDYATAVSTTLAGGLDALDGDPDREASLAGFNPISWYSGQDVDLEGDFSDYEPSLGWAERA